MRTHGVGLWLAVTVSGVAVGGRARANDETKPSTGRSTAEKADQPAYVDTNIDDKAVRAGKKAARVVEGAANEAGEHLSDGWITSKVKTKLLAEEHLDSSGISVETTKRVVYLRGSVQKDSERVRAVEIAKNTQGVYGVLDDLAVGEPARVQRKNDPRPASTSAWPTPGEVTGATKTRNDGP